MANNPFHIFTDKKVLNGKMLAVTNFIEANYGKLSATPEPYYNLAWGTTIFTLPDNQILYIEQTEVVPLKDANTLEFAGTDGLGNNYDFRFTGQVTPIILDDILLKSVTSETGVKYQSVKGWLFTYEI